jgi:hypothetical protein
MGLCVQSQHIPMSLSTHNITPKQYSYSLYSYSSSFAWYSLYLSSTEFLSEFITSQKKFTCHPNDQEINTHWSFKLFIIDKTYFGIVHVILKGRWLVIPMWLTFSVQYSVLHGNGIFATGCFGIRRLTIRLPSA